MAAADPLTDEYVLAWLQTGPGAQDKGIFARAEELREALLKHGYGSLAGLRVLTEDELKQVKVGTKTIPAGIRALLMADLQGRWTLQPTAQRRVRFGEREKRPREQWVGGPKFPAATASGFPEVEQMQAYIKRLITFADAHDAGVADAVDKLRRAVCDEGRTLTPEEVEEALLGSGEGADRQLAAVVEAAMPDVTMNLIVDKIGIRKGGLQILQAILESLFAVKEHGMLNLDDAMATVTKPVTVTEKNQLYKAIVAWESARKACAAAKETVPDRMAMQGLRQLVRLIPEALEELERQKSDARRSKKAVSRQEAYEALRELGQGWLTAPSKPKANPNPNPNKPKQPKAKAHMAQGELSDEEQVPVLPRPRPRGAGGQQRPCFQWIDGHCSRSKCPFKHEEGAKGAANKECVEFQQKGLCTTKCCPFQHRAQVAIPQPQQPQQQAQMAADSDGTAMLRMMAQVVDMMGKPNTVPCRQPTRDTALPQHSRPFTDPQRSVTDVGAAAGVRDVVMPKDALVPQAEQMSTGVFRDSSCEKANHINSDTHNVLEGAGDTVQPPCPPVPPQTASGVGVDDATARNPESVLPPLVPHDRATKAVVTALHSDDTPIQFGATPGMQTQFGDRLRTSVVPALVTTLVYFLTVADSIRHMSSQWETDYDGVKQQRKRALTAWVVDKFSCGDTGATVDVLGSKHCGEASNVTPCQYELLTAGGTKQVRSTGDVQVTPGLRVQQGWMAPWMDTTLISITSRLAEGGGFVAQGDKAMLVTSQGSVHPFRLDKEGLLRPLVQAERGYLNLRSGKVTSTTSGEVQETTQDPKKSSGLADFDAAQPPEDEEEDQKNVEGSEAKAAKLKVRPKAAEDKPTRSATKTQRQWLNAARVLSVLMMLAMQMSGNVTEATSHGAIKSVLLDLERPTPSTRASKQRPRVKQAECTLVEHCIRGHRPFHPDCKACRLGSMTVKPATRNDWKLELEMANKGYVLGVDFVGPFKPDTDGNKYAFIGVEVGHTNYGMVVLQKTREATETTASLKLMQRHLEMQGSKELVRVHSDNDKSFRGDFAKYLVGAQIAQTNTGGYRPTANSRTERRIRMILDALRANLLVAHGMTRDYEGLWGQGFKYTMAAINKTAWSDGVMPHKELTGVEYQFGKEDHVFGSYCEYQVPAELRDEKWEMAGREAIWVGRHKDNPQESTVPDGHVVIPIKWNSDDMTYELGSTIVTPHVKNVNDIKYPLKMGPDEKNNNVPEDDFESFMDDVCKVLYKPEPIEAYSHLQVDGEDPIMEVEAILGRKGKGRGTKYKVKWKGYNKTTWESAREMIRTGASEMVEEYKQSQKSKSAQAKLATPSSDDERAVEQLITRQKVKGSVQEWLPGYQAEMAAMKKLRLEEVSEATRDEVLKNGTAVKLRMNLEPKKDGRKKGRLILQGFLEPKSWDGGSVDSPVASMTSIRTLLFMKGNPEDDVISSCDVCTAFLQAEKYAPTDAPRYVTYQAYPGARVEVYRLTGPTYGQRSSSLRWHKTLTSWLLSEGFQAGENCPCTFVHKDTGFIVLTYVDDILCRGSLRDSRAFYKKLEQRFEIKDPDYLTTDSPLKFVGFEVEMSRADGVDYREMHQKTEVGLLLDGMSVSPSKNARSPMPNKHTMYRNNTPLEATQAGVYRSVVGSLNYFAACTRYDIAYATSRLSRHCAYPTQGNWDAMMRVLSYLKATEAFGIGSPVTKGIDVVEYYSDSDHAGQVLPK